MRSWIYLIGLSILFISCVTSDNKEVEAEVAEKQVFQLIESDSSGISFQNKLVHDVGTRSNLFDFDYFYNGAGVGVADINNDDLPDIFFAGNQVPNKLFLNLGGLKFEDISDSAGINAGKNWSNGVSFVDINHDGLQDIYVSQGGPYDADRRKNLLFINNGDLTFTESATQYGLGDTGFSTQSVFFDFDKDGDKDLIVMNENPLYGMDPVNFYRRVSREKGLMHQSSSHFYINDGSKFEDATAQVGILRPSFGLGLVVSDINDDGWLDIYMANDYFIPDAMFINQGNGTFFDEIKLRTKQISFFGMGADIADLNNDMFKDILVLDMASQDHIRSKTLMASMDVDNFSMLVDQFGFAHQYMFNSLQLNHSNNSFGNIAHQLGVAKTDWSWAGLMADFNNDGNKDIYVTNGYRRYATDNDFRNKVAATQQAYKGRVPLDVKAELYDQMPSEKLANQLFKNDGNLEFSETSESWGLSIPSYSNGAAYADLDVDGDLDIIVNNIDDQAFLFRNESVDLGLGNFLRVSTPGAEFSRVSILANSQWQVIEQKGVRGYFSYSEPTAHFGIGEATTIDSVVVNWLDGTASYETEVSANQTLTMSTSQAINSNKTDEENLYFELVDLNLDIRHVENDYNDYELEVLLPYKQSQLGPMISKGDINGDGLEDIYAGGASGQPGFVLIQTDVGFIKTHQPYITNDSIHEDLGSAFFDLDSDGDLDLYVVSGGNEKSGSSTYYMDRLYLNDGTGVFKKQEMGSNLSQSFSGKTLSTIDFDNDGDLDLFIANRIVPQKYPAAAKSYLLRNDGGNLTDVTDEFIPDIMGFGIINDVIVSDFSGDGLDDLIVAGEWTSIGFFKNTGEGFDYVSDEMGFADMRGWWYSITETDINGDNLPDYLVGNIGLNTKFKTSKDKPFKVFGGDFDENGTFDVVLSNVYNGEYVPVRGRECSSQQMPFIAQKYNDYESFANASVEDIYGDKLQSSISLEANEFRSFILINKSGGFEAIPLPTLAQASPILSSVSVDINNDGYEDIISAGNIYTTEVETPRWDFSKGLVMISNGVDGYEELNSSQSGLYLDGDIKQLSLIELKGQNKTFLVATRNNDTPIVHSLKLNTSSTSNPSSSPRPQ